MKQPMAALVLFLFSGVGAVIIETRGADDRNIGQHLHGFLSASNKMQPDVAAATLAKVENEWVAQAAFFARCSETEEDCSSAARAFDASCSKVVSTIVKASAGNRDSVKEYMGDVCGEALLDGPHRDRCLSLQSSIVSGMSDNAVDNREHLDASHLCQKLWARIGIDEKARADREAKEWEAEQQRRAEEEKKAAEAAAKAAEAEEQRRLKEEAAKKAKEAQQLADQAAARLAAKKKEAEEHAELARRKMEEVRKAGEETLRAQAMANATKKVAVKGIARNASITAVPVVEVAASAQTGKQPMVDGVPANATAANASAPAVRQTAAPVHAKNVVVPLPALVSISLPAKA